MSFYMNPFAIEYRGSICLGHEGKEALTFSVPANKNRSEYMESYAFEPYDLSSFGTFTINYAYDPNFKNYSSLGISVAGGTAAATLASEVVTALNANTTFADLFVAETRQVGGKNRVL